jgi:hypothetical protein
MVDFIVKHLSLGIIRLGLLCTCVCVLNVRLKWKIFISPSGAAGFYDARGDKTQWLPLT